MHKNQIFYLTCTILTMVIIFLFSHQPSANSYKASNLLVKPLTNELKETSSKEFKDEDEEKSYWKSIRGKIELAVRKTAHVFIYTLLSLFIYLTLKSFNINIPDIYMYTLILCILYGISDEIHQSFVGRHAYFTDVCIDSFGAIIIIISMWLKDKIKIFTTKGDAL